AWRRPRQSAHRTAGETLQGRAEAPARPILAAPRLRKRASEKDAVGMLGERWEKDGQELVSPKEDTMKLVSTCFALACGLCALLGPQALAQHTGEHIMLAPSELTWKDLPSLP